MYYVYYFIEAFCEREEEKKEKEMAWKIETFQMENNFRNW